MCPIRSLGTLSHESPSCARLSRREPRRQPWLGTTLLLYWEREHPHLAWWACGRVPGTVGGLTPLLSHRDMPVVFIVDGVAAPKLGELPGRLPYVLGFANGVLVPAHLHMIVLVIPQIVYRFPNQPGPVTWAAVCAILRQN
jgi:hypothetical protein